MKTFVINLDRNPERLAFVKAQLDAFGQSFERCPAVDGRKPDALDDDYAPVRSFIASKRRLSRAEVAVAKSHLSCYRRMVADGIPLMLVLEDDIRLSAAFPATLARIEAFADVSRPQLILLSGYGVASGESLPEEIRAESAAWCADAYVLTLPAARLILRVNSPVRTVADAFKRWHRRFGLELYRALPTCARQEDDVFPSENTVLPKTSWPVRNLLWVIDWLLCKVSNRGDRPREMPVKRG